MKHIKNREVRYFVYGCNELKKQLLNEIKLAQLAESSGISPVDYLVNNKAKHLIKDQKNNITYLSAIYLLFQDRITNFDYVRDDAVDDLPF